VTIRVYKPNGKKRAVAFKLTEGILLVGGPRGRAYSHAQIDRIAWKLNHALLAEGTSPLFAAVQLSRLAAALATVAWQDRRKA